MIAPGYRFRLADQLITNFHQPGSTLLLLVAAVVGERWRALYQHALQHEYRFLSYGDSSLLRIHPDHKWKRTVSQEKDRITGKGPNHNNKPEDKHNDKPDDKHNDKPRIP
jgi:hypothetical protein